MPEISVLQKHPVCQGNDKQVGVLNNQLPLKLKTLVFLNENIGAVGQCPFGP